MEVIESKVLKAPRYRNPAKPDNINQSEYTNTLMIKRYFTRNRDRQGCLTKAALRFNLDVKLCLIFELVMMLRMKQHVGI